MNITAEAVKQLRERTGAGMMECKKALVETKRRPGCGRRAHAQAGPRQGRQEGGAHRGRGRRRHRDARPTAARPPWSRSTARPISSRASRISAPSPRTVAQVCARGPARRLEALAAARAARRRERRGAPPGPRRQDRREHQRAALRGAQRPGRTSAPTSTARASARWSRSKGGDAERSRTIWPCTSRRAIRSIVTPARGAGRRGRQGAGDPHRAGARRRASPPRSSPRWSRDGCASTLAEITLAGPALREGPGHEHREAAEGLRRRRSWASSASRSARASRKSRRISSPRSWRRSGHGPAIRH